MEKKKGLVLGGILLLGIGFASISTTLYINGNVNISANMDDFDVVFTKAVIDSVDESSTSISEDGKTISFTTKELQELNDKSVLDFEVTNNSSLYDAEVSIECTSGEKGEYYQINKEVASIIPAKTIDKGNVEVQKIKLAKENIEESFTCTLTATAKERTTKDESTLGVNKNIVNSSLECLKDKSAGSCVPGTEIRYMVNDTTEKTFNVLHDDGEIIVMQDKSTTVPSVKWYSSNDNSKGPLTAIEAVESATSDWTNVNKQTYTMGATNFNETNANTGCSLVDDVWNCIENTYTWEERSANARMITAQEALSVGCSKTENSCPIWMRNGGSYWTMSAIADSSLVALGVSRGYGNLGNGWNYGDGTLDVRAVVVISK